MPDFSRNKRKAVFLDRDGVINDGTRYYTYLVEDFVFNDGIFEGLAVLRDLGYIFVVVTNQSGVAKGEYTHADVQAVHRYMGGQLALHGIELAGIYYCPHHESVGDCSCRKPKPGMLLQALQELNIDPSLSFMIGDSKRDIEAAELAGIQGIKIGKNESIIPACQHIAKIIS